MKLFYYWIDAMPLTNDELDHLRKCSHCQSVLQEWETYIDPRKMHAA